MGRKGSCLVCAAVDKRKELEERFDGGESLRSLARLSGLAEPTIRRHINRCRPAPPATISDTATGPTPRKPESAAAPTDGSETQILELLKLPAGVEPTPVISFLQEHVRSLKDLYDDARTTDKRNAPQISAQIARTVGMLNALIAEREQPKPAEERLTDHPDFTAFLGLLARTLDRHPEAREDVRLAIEDLLGEVPA